MQPFLMGAASATNTPLASADAEIKASPTPLDFGEIGISGPTQTLSTQIENTGDEATLIGNLQVTGPFSIDGSSTCGDPTFLNPSGWAKKKAPSASKSRSPAPPPPARSRRARRAFPRSPTTSVRSNGSSNCGSLSPGVNCKLQVQFTPNSASSYEANLELASNGTANPLVVPSQRSPSPAQKRRSNRVRSISARSKSTPRQQRSR